MVCNKFSCIKVYFTMFNCKILKKNNLISNLKKFGNKKICAMVKSNAYGHGLKEIVEIVKSEVECFGVVNLDEALAVRKFTDKPILICAKVQNFRLCKKYGFEIIVDDELDIRNCVKYGIQDGVHLKLNCGMNRFGIKSDLNLQMIDKLIQDENLTLESICTHFPCTENRRKTMQQYEKFMQLRSYVGQNVDLCFGGSGVSKYPFDFDMLRLGIGMYGYGQKDLLPVMEIRSFVSKTFYAKKGEYIGYGNKFKVQADGFFAVVPVGYGDGLMRGLSGKFKVKINGRKYQAVGNICMDAFFVKVDSRVKCMDEVMVMWDAKYLAKQVDTISYEVLTNFSSFRGKTIVE